MKILNLLLLFLNFSLFTSIISYNDTNYLILVNKNNCLNESYKPKNLVYMDNVLLARDVFIEKEVYYNYLLFYNESLLKNYKFMVYSGYRDYSYQKNIYIDNSYIAKPGCSEHQTGLALDVSLEDVGLTEYLEDYEEYKYLKDNIHKYGFIIRYPKNKKSITHISYEPWHLRYVGVKCSTYIYNNNLTLEEYLKKA